MLHRFRIACLAFSITSASILNGTATLAQDKPANVAKAPAAKISKAQFKVVVTKAAEYLRVSGQSEDGSFSKQQTLGVTSLVVAGLLSCDVPREDPVVAKSLAFIEKAIQPDGGIYSANSKHTNYETCLAILALVKANHDGKYKDVLAKAEEYVKKQQWDEGEGAKSDDPTFGGAGYGSKSRPDLSNTSFLLDALHDLGRDGDDEAIQRALVFVSRCQNHASASNDTPFANKVNDGGFYYTPAAGGDSMAGKDENGGLRSYASMTYAGLKSMIFAGVSKDDARVKAATAFLKKNYTLDANPGMGTSGLFYYYQTMAKALTALQVDEFETESGAKPWKQELFTKLASTQNANGSWVNADARWLEGDPNLVTGYALLTLSYLKPTE